MRAAKLAVLSVVIVASALALARRVGSPGLRPPQPAALGSPTADVFTDELTRVSLARPAGWRVMAGPTLRQRASAQAGRPGEARGASTAGDRIELLVRFTRYAPGEAPGPNPMIVVSRFDLRRFPAGTGPGDLLRIEIASARAESAPATVQLGRRPWRKITAARELPRPDGATIDILEEVYVTTGATRGLGIVMSAPRSQFADYRSAFDAVLRSVRFQ